MFSRKVMIARLIASEIFTFGFQDYMCIKDKDIENLYVIMLYAMKCSGKNIPNDWKIKEEN